METLWYLIEWGPLQSRTRSRSGLDVTGLHDWVSVEIFQAVIKELPSMIDRINDRMIVIFIERIVATQDIDEKTRETPGGS